MRLSRILAAILVYPALSASCRQVGDIAVAFKVADAELQGVGSGLARYAADGDVVPFDFFQRNLAEIGDDVGRNVLRRVVDFVHELFLDGLDRYEAAGVLRLRQDKAALFTDFDNGIAQELRTGYVFPVVVVVSACGLGAAFAEMAGQMP